MMFEVQRSFGNALAGGMAMGEQNAQSMQRQKQQALFAEYGAGIANGDPNSINALAGMDPVAALGVRNTIADNRRADAGLEMQREGLGMRREELDMRKQQIAAETARSAAAMSAAERQAAIEEYDNARRGLVVVQSPEQFERLKQEYQQRMPDMDFSGLRFEDRAVLAAELDGVIEGLKIAEGPEAPAAVQALRIRAQEAGLQPGTPEYSQFMLDGGRKQDGMRITTGPDGQMIVEQGSAVTAGGAPKKLTEGQSKGIIYATRAKGALETYEPIATASSSRTGRALDYVPGGFGREFQDDDYQVAKASGQEFLQAILRKDTGAAITEQEQVLYGNTYLDQPGDGPAATQYRKEARARAIQALERGMTAAEMRAMERPLMKAALGDEADADVDAPVSENPYVGITDEDFNAMDIDSLTPEQIDQLFEARQ